MIQWQPIDELPDRLKDGQDVLFWDGAAELGQWCKRRGCWVDGCCGQPMSHRTHFAEVTGPDRRG